MPIVTRPNGSRVTDAGEIEAIVHALGLSLGTVALPASAALAEVEDDHHLSDARICAILDDYDAVLGDAHVGSDVFALFGDSPNRDHILARFARAHRHGDAETRLILSGRGVFGFVLSDGAQVEVEAGPGELIQIPAGVEHWFRLADDGHVVAVRLFQANPDWRADYTGTPILFSFATTRTLHD